MRPHDKLFTRLAVSEISGIGVVAIRPIPQGTYPFSSYNMKWVKVPEAEVNSLPPLIRQMYHDFFPLRDGYYEGIFDMNRMDISFYLNHSDTPNMACDSDDEFYALRDIAEGEELTVDYGTYSEQGI